MIIVQKQKNFSFLKSSVTAVWLLFLLVVQVNASDSIIVSLQEFKPQEAKELLKKIIPEPKIIEELIFESNNAIAVKEFEYLANFSEGQLVSLELITDFLKMAEKKKRFKQVVVTSVLLKSGIKLSFSFKSYKNDAPAILRNSVVRSIKNLRIYSISQFGKFFYNPLFNLSFEK